MDRLALILIWALAMSACQSPRVVSPASSGVQAAPVQTAGAYLVVMGTVHDRKAFMEGYVSRLPPLYARYGGRYVAVSGQFDTLEGDPGFESVVISAWPSVEAARAFWTSPEYQALADTRISNGWGSFRVILVPALPTPDQQ